MILRAVALLLALTTALAVNAPAGDLRVYIEDNHAGTFYWLAEHLNLDESCTLVHFDAHSDASAIFDSDKIRGALRHVVSTEERAELLGRWRGQGVIQSFNWIEPLMPAPISKVIWVPAEQMSAADLAGRLKRATALLDGQLEAAPRQAGPFTSRYVISDLAGLESNLPIGQPLIVTIDLDFFSGSPPAEQAWMFDQVWRFVIRQKNLRAITFAISRPYLRDDEEADRLLGLALAAVRLLPAAHIDFEPFATVSHDRSARAKELKMAGQSLPSYDVTRGSDSLKSAILADASRITVRQDQVHWAALLRDWSNETAGIHLEVKDVEQSTDDIWRVPITRAASIEIVAEPWTAKLQQVDWFVLTPAHPAVNVSSLDSDQVGFIANAAPQLQWKRTVLAEHAAVLPLKILDRFLDPKSHCGSVRVAAWTVIDGKTRETPVIEVRRFAGSGFRAAITEQFALPYIFGSGELANESETGPETGWGADCANFVIYALRRQGMRIPWSDPKQFRQHLELVAASTQPGEAHFTGEDLERGLVVHLGTHVAAVMEDRAPFGVLDENDVVAHQLKGLPETLTLGELLTRRHSRTFDLLRVPSFNNHGRLVFGGDVMLGRTCGEKIERGVDLFAEIRDLLQPSLFAAANLECTICPETEPSAPHRYSFRAPLRSAIILRQGGFRALALANNHALDFGANALQKCAQILTQENLEPVGVAGTRDAIPDPYAAKIFQLSGRRTLALLAASALLFNNDEESPATSLIARASNRARLGEAIQTARRKAQVVACMIHWGVENSDRITASQRELARWLINEGVDVVIGSHPHRVQPLDFYHGHPIAYSLGNLVFDGAATVPAWNRGALLELRLSGTGKIETAEMRPVQLEDGLPRRPRPAEDTLVKK